MPKPYYKNVAGDFYVEEGCCITCAVPMSEAPEFFEMDDEQCFVKRQPETPADFDRMFDALMTQEVGCIRYEGSDRRFLRRLVNVGDGEICDALPDMPDIRPLLRAIVRFRCDLELASDVLSLLTATPRTMTDYDRIRRYGFRKEAHGGTVASVEFAWNSDDFHKIVVFSERTGVFLVRLTPKRPTYLPGLARMFHAWLGVLPGLSDINWMTENEFARGHGQPTPY